MDTSVEMVLGFTNRVKSHPRSSEMFQYIARSAADAWREAANANEFQQQLTASLDLFKDLGPFEVDYFDMATHEPCDISVADSFIIHLDFAVPCLH